MTRVAVAWVRGGAAALLVGVLGIGGATVTRADAPPRHVDVNVRFDNLLPGETRTATVPVDMQLDARVAGVRLQEQGPAGAVRWSARLCGAASTACFDLLAGAPGAEIGRGAHTFVVSVTAVDLGEGQAASLVGRVQLAESGTLPDTGADGRLALTGTGDAASLVATALAAVSVGALLVALAHHRRTADDDGSEPC